MTNLSDLTLIFGIELIVDSLVTISWSLHPELTVLFIIPLLLLIISLYWWLITLTKLYLMSRQHRFKWHQTHTVKMIVYSRSLVTAIDDFSYWSFSPNFLDLCIATNRTFINQNEGNCHSCHVRHLSSCDTSTQWNNYPTNNSYDGLDVPVVINHYSCHMGHLSNCDTSTQWNNYTTSKSYDGLDGPVVINYHSCHVRHLSSCDTSTQWKNY